MATSGDLDGDGFPDVVALSRPRTLQVIEWGLDGLENRGALAVGAPAPFPPSESERLRVETIRFIDFDGDREDELLAYCTLRPRRGERRGGLDGHLVLFERGSDGAPLKFHAAALLGLNAVLPGTPGSIAVLAAGTGGLEVALGTESGPGDSRQVWTVRDPFAERFQRGKHMLKLLDPQDKSDVKSLFSGDFDGDRKLDLGAALGPWNAFGLRIWTRRDGTFSGPLRVGPAGEFARAERIRLEGDTRDALFLAADTAYYNQEHLREPPHTGVAPGAYLFRLPDGERIDRRTISVSFRDPEKTFLWSDRFPEALTPPMEAAHPLALSVARWQDGRTVAALAWQMRQAEGESHFADLFVQERGLPQFTRHRLSWRRRGALVPVLLALKPAGAPGEDGLVLFEAQEGSDACRARAWRFARREPFALASAPRQLEACFRTERYDLAVAIAKESIDKAASREEEASIALAWGTAALRVFDREERAASIHRIQELRASGAFGPPESALDARAAELVAAAEALERLEAVPPLTVGDAAFRSGESPRTQVLLDEEALAGWAGRPFDLLLSFEVTIEALGLDRSVYLGLFRGEYSDTDDEVAGVVIVESGGKGQELQRLQPVWVSKRKGYREYEPDEAIEECRTYLCRLARTADGRVQLRVEDLESGRTFWAVEPLEGQIEAITGGNAEGADLRQPIAGASGYRFGLIDRKPTGDTTTVLTFGKIELRVAAVGE